MYRAQLSQYPNISGGKECLAYRKRLHWLSARAYIQCNEVNNSEISWLSQLLQPVLWTAKMTNSKNFLKWKKNIFVAEEKQSLTISRCFFRQSDVGWFLCALDLIFIVQADWCFFLSLNVKANNWIYALTEHVEQLIGFTHQFNMSSLVKLIPFDGGYIWRWWFSGCDARFWLENSAFQHLSGFTAKLSEHFS